MNLKPGLRLKSQVSETEIVVVKGTGDHELACGGVPLVALDEPVADGAATAPDQTGSTLLGKRYTDAADSVEVLCTKPGSGALSLDGEALEIKSAKALPASD
ncbi:MAG: hypothetical protein ABSC41_18775 [Acidimicrobiales bacterium]|jgi:hypothetical protein